MEVNGTAQLVCRAPAGAEEVRVKRTTRHPVAVNKCGCPCHSHGGAWGRRVDGGSPIPHAAASCGRAAMQCKCPPRAARSRGAVHRIAQPRLSVSLFSGGGVVPGGHSPVRSSRLDSHLAPIPRWNRRGRATERQCRRALNHGGEVQAISAGGQVRTHALYPQGAGGAEGPGAWTHSNGHSAGAPMHPAKVRCATRRPKAGGGHDDPVK